MRVQSQGHPTNILSFTLRHRSPIGNQCVEWDKVLCLSPGCISHLAPDEPDKSYYNCIVMTCTILPGDRWRWRKKYFWGCLHHSPPRRWTCCGGAGPGRPGCPPGCRRRTCSSCSEQRGSTGLIRSPAVEQWEREGGQEDITNIPNINLFSYNLVNPRQTE